MPSRRAELASDGVAIHDGSEPAVVSGRERELVPNGAAPGGTGMDSRGICLRVEEAAPCDCDGDDADGSGGDGDD